MSIKIRSGWCTDAREIPAVAVVASKVRKPLCWRRSRDSFMFFSLSSTRRTSSSAMERFLARARPASDQLDEALPIELRLPSEHRDPPVQARLVRGSHRLRRQNDNRDRSGGGIGPERLDDGKAVDVWH